MSLTGAPTTYAQFLKDVGDVFVEILRGQQNGPGVPGHTASFDDIAANRVDHQINWDGTPMS